MIRSPAPVAAERQALIVLALVGFALVVLTAVGPWLNHRYGGKMLWAIFVVTAAGAFWAAVWSRAASHGSTDARAAVIVILTVGVALRLAQIGIEPYLSDDIYRYVWDGRVQAAGINPFRFIPAAPELTGLRDAAIYPFINRADYAPTIYPPTAQMFFLAATRLGESVLVMKLALVACEAFAIYATMIILERLELPPTRIAAFAWHPLPVWEIAGSGHVDALMVGLMMLALVVFVSGRTLLAGAIATAAALVKPTALLMLPMMWRPWRLALPAVVVLTVVALYAPYLSAGWQVLGFLPGYVAEEGLSQGYGFRFVMIAQEFFGPLRYGGVVFAVAAGGIMLALAFATSFRKDRSDAASIASLTILLTAFLVLLTPHYPWYYLALMPFLAIYPRSRTLWVLTVAGVLSYDAIPNDPLPEYIHRQIAFNAMVILALVRDVMQRDKLAPATGATTP